MAEKRPPSPTLKPVKTKIPVPKQLTSKTNIPLESKIIIRPINYQEGQNALYPPNQLTHLPDIPAAPHNNPPNLPNPPNPLPNPLNAPNPPNPPNPPTPPPNPHDPMNPPDPPQPHQLNWSYFKPEFLGKTEEDAMAHLLKIGPLDLRSRQPKQAQFT